MTVVTVPLSDTFDQWRIKFNEIVTVQNAQISDVSRAALLTTATDIVPAINEVKGIADTAATDVTGKVDKAGDTMTGNLVLDTAVGIDLSSTSSIKNSTAEILLDEDGVGPDQVPLDAHRTGTFDSLLGFNGSGAPEYFLKSALGAEIDVIDLNDTPASYTGFAGFHLAVKGAEDGIEFVAAGGGTYIALTDTPGAFAGDAYKAVRVSGASNALVHAGTGAVLMDSGTTAQRPGSAVNGMIRYNTSNNEMESFENGVWGGLGTTEASKAEIEAQSAVAKFVPPDLVKHSPGVAKAWVNFDQQGTQSITASYNISGIVDTGVGDTRITIDANFSNANYIAICGQQRNRTATTVQMMVNIDRDVANTAGQAEFRAYESDVGSNDQNSFYVAFYGDQ